MERTWEWVSIDDIIPYENNARKHTEESIETVANSIKQFGWKNAIVVDEENVILAGHGRRLAALKLGLKEVPVIRFNDLTEEQKKAYRLADNKTAENSGWDFPALDLELEDITTIDMADFGFIEYDMSIDDSMFGEAEPKEPKQIKCPHCGEWFTP